MRFNMDGYSEFMEFNYEIDLLKGNDVVLTQKLVKPLVISNNYSMMVRDENFQPIADPNNEGEFLKIPAFDYVHDLMMVKNIPLANIMTLYILEEAADGFFNV